MQHAENEEGMDDIVAAGSPDLLDHEVDDEDDSKPYCLGCAGVEGDGWRRRTRLQGKDQSQFNVVCALLYEY